MKKKKEKKSRNTETCRCRRDPSRPSISMGNYQSLEGIWSSIPCDFHESGIEELQAI